MNKMAIKREALRPLAVFLVFLVAVTPIAAQSNYASHANNVEYTSDGLPEEATLDGKVTKLDDLSPIIFLNRTKAALNCAAGSMQVDLKFNEKFYGLAYADFDRNSACNIQGKGDLTYRLELPLKGCGTRQEPQRVFTNNIVVRFHPGLEMDGDEIITIVCRYPPPVAPIPAGLPAPILTEPLPPLLAAAPLKGIQILFIICALMFLTLLLLGLGVSYYCLRRRPVTVVRRLPMSMGSGSEITKLSGSSLGQMSGFESLKIPRAHAALAAVHSSSGSDGPLISDTIPSDYPSESHSEIEDVDTRSLPASSAGSYENRAYLQDNSSLYSEHYGHTQEFQTANAQMSQIPRLPLAVRESSPQFDVQVRVKRPAPSPPSPQSSDTESMANSRIDRQNLSTIMESHEDRESVFTMESMPHDVAHSHFTYVPELHPAPRHAQAPPVFSKIMKRQMQQQQQQQQPQQQHHHHHGQERLGSWPEDYVDAPLPPHSIPDSHSIVTLGTEMTDTHSVGEMIDSSHRYPNEYHRNAINIETVEVLPEPPIHAMRKPEITSHVVDDVFLRTITEKKTIEDIEKHKRLITEYKAKAAAPPPPPPPNPTWDVTIRNIPTETTRPKQWEDFSDVSSASGMPLTPKLERPKFSMPPMNYIDENGKKLTSPELVGNMKPIEMPPKDTAVQNWDVLIRILEEPADEEAVSDTHSDHTAVTTHTNASYLNRHLSYEDKTKWKEIITTESTLRSMLTEAVVREDFERIRSDVRYEQIFEPQSWDVIIRILAPPEDDVELRQPKRNRPKETWDTRSRRSSLPTLYEYDSDNSSVRTIPQEHNVMQIHQPGNPYAANQQPSRRTSRTSSTYRSDNVDMRSMTETTVNFARPDMYDNYSDTSSTPYPNTYYDEDRRSLHRSLSHPSLARSASEFMEHWVAPENGSEASSPEPTPRVSRSQRVMTTFQSSARPNHEGGPGGSSSSAAAQVSEQYVEQRSSTFHSSSGGAAPKNWYGDQGKQ